MTRGRALAWVRVKHVVGQKGGGGWGQAVKRREKKLDWVRLEARIGWTDEAAGKTKGVTMEQQIEQHNTQGPHLSLLGVICLPVLNALRRHVRICGGRAIVARQTRRGVVQIHKL